MADDVELSAKTFSVLNAFVFGLVAPERDMDQARTYINSQDCLNLCDFLDWLKLRRILVSIERLPTVSWPKNLRNIIEAAFLARKLKQMGRYLPMDDFYDVYCCLDVEHRRKFSALFGVRPEEIHLKYEEPGEMGKLKQIFTNME